MSVCEFCVLGGGGGGGVFAFHVPGIKFFIKEYKIYSD